MKEQWLTTEEAAKILERTDRQVRRYCKDGSLVHERQGNQLFIDAESVYALKEMQDESPPEQEEDIEEDIPESPVGDPTPAPPARDIEVPAPEPIRDSETLVLQEEMGSLDQKLKKRLGEESRYVSDVKQALNQLDRRYKAERERNRRIQTALRKLLQELQVPLSEEKPSFWRRLFNR